MGIAETGVQKSLDAYGISLESRRNYALGFIPTSSYYVIAVPKEDKERVESILEAMNRRHSDAKKLGLAGMELDGESLKIKGNLLAASSLIQQNLAVSLSSDKEKAITRAVAVHFGGLGAKHLNEFDRIDADADREIEFSDLDRDSDKRLTKADADALRAQISPQAYSTLIASLEKQGVEFKKKSKYDSALEFTI